RGRRDRAGDGRRDQDRDDQTRAPLQRSDRPGPLVHQPGRPGARRSPRGKVPRAREIAVDGPWAAGRQGELRIFVRGSPCCIPAVAPVVPTALTAPAPTALTAPASGPDGPRPASDCSAVAPPATNRIQSRPHVPHN